MNDPFIGSQSNRSTSNVPSFSKGGVLKPAEAETKPLTDNGAKASPSGQTPPSQLDPSKQRLTSFLGKLETTWKLFHRSTRESDIGHRLEEKAPMLDEKEMPSADSLKELRARAMKSGDYASGKPASNPATGPKAGPSTPSGSSGTEGSKGARAGMPAGPGPEAAKPRAGSSSTASPQTQPQSSPSSSSARPTGQATSQSFLATSTSYGVLRPPLSGKPGTPHQMEMLARQPIFSQSVAQVNPRITTRQVTGESPIHSPFLDDLHEESSGLPSPLRLFWTKASQAPKQNRALLAGQARLRFAPQGRSGKSLGSLVFMTTTSSAASARTEVATRFAGKAIHKLLEKLYDEDELDELDEEGAVSGLGLILRLGGEFTYEHSTRVLDLALALADEVGVKDKATRKEIKYGALFRDAGEFDLLLQGDSREKSMRSLEDFLGGQDMLRAGLLHDIGKVNIPPEILYKPGKLTPEEYELMKMHPIYGESIVRPITCLRYLCPTIRGHHERWDGLGYPDGLKGETIPMAARIISVADVFDALSAERPYKQGMEVAKVKGILAEGRGTHFDPSLVDAFLRIIDRRYPNASEDQDGSGDGDNCDLKAG